MPYIALGVLVVGGLCARFLICCFALLVVVKQGVGRTVEWADQGSGLMAGDEVIAVAGERSIGGWEDFRPAVACWPAECDGLNECTQAHWDADSCTCSSRIGARAAIL